MPYTPPAQLSPAISSSTQAYTNTASPHYGYFRPARSPGSSPGAGLPRSRSSSAASRKKQEEEVIRNTMANSQLEDSLNKHEPRLNIDTSVRQSPPPLTESYMPVQAVISPPDSGHTSDDEPSSKKPASEDTKETEDLQELEKAVRESLKINRRGSPEPELDRQFSFPAAVDGQEASQEEATKPLTEAARKVSHSRSSTDSAILYSPAPSATASPGNVSVSDGSDDDGEKPPLIRKKSGELVKPAIRPKNRRAASSMPGTPTYGGKKGVHFNDQLQQVKHFLQVDRPIAVSAGGSPVEAFDSDSEFPFGKPPPSPTSAGIDIRLGNFPRQTFERQSKLVRLDKLTLSADQKFLMGHVVVANIAFHKQVVARFTFDFWKTTSEVAAEYNADPLHKLGDGFDPFKFTVKLSDHKNLEKKTMIMCVRYTVNGQDYWDNNNDANFLVDFVKRSNVPSSAPGLGSRPIPRSRRSSMAPNRPMSMPSFDDDFARNFDAGPPLKLRQPPNSSVAQPGSGRVPTAQGRPLSGRYDFGTSLTAALNQAASKLGDRSGLQAKGAQSATPPRSSIADLRRHTPPAPLSPSERPRPDDLHANKTTTDSIAYQNFVSRWCFFGSGNAQGSTNSPTQTPNQPKSGPSSMGTDGALDDRPSQQIPSTSSPTAAMGYNYTYSPDLSATTTPTTAIQG